MTRISAIDWRLYSVFHCTLHVFLRHKDFVFWHTFYDENCLFMFPLSSFKILQVIFQSPCIYVHILLHFFCTKFLLNTVRNIRNRMVLIFVDRIFSKAIGKKMFMFYSVSSIKYFHKIIEKKNASKISEMTVLLLVAVCKLWAIPDIFSFSYLTFRQAH